MQRRDLLRLSLAVGASQLAASLGCAAKTTFSGQTRIITGRVPPPTRRTDSFPRARIVYFAPFGITESMIAEVLRSALATGGDYADVFFQHTVTSSMGLEDGAVNRAFASVDLGVGVRVVKGEQTGYGYTEDLTLEAVKTAASTAAIIANGPARSVSASFRADPTPFDAFPKRYELTRSWAEVMPEQKLPILTKLNQRALAADPRIKKVSLSMRTAHGAVLIADSLGRLVEDTQPMTSMVLSCTAEQRGRRETNAYNLAARDGFEFYTQERLDRLLDRAVKRTLVLFDAVTLTPGEMPVVLAPGSSGLLLHEAIGHGMEADFNRKKTSIFADKIGKLVAKPFVNIVDDGTLEHARGSINVDDEGNVAGKTMLVENGKLATYLHDAISAKHYGVSPTGNGRRESFRFAPIPRMRTTYMHSGPHHPEEIVRSVKKGIYCEHFGNGAVQIGAGDFTFYVKNGRLIEDGKLTRPIKDVNLIGNGPKILEKIDMVGDDLKIDEGGWTCGKDGQGVPVSHGMPTVRIESVTVGGRKS